MATAKVTFTATPTLT